MLLTNTKRVDAYFSTDVDNAGSDKSQCKEKYKIEIRLKYFSSIDDSR